jgi:hypothetical protein
MPDALFGKSLREVYVNLLIGGETEDWEQFIRLLNVSSAHELRTRIEAALTTLKECDSSGSLSDFSTSLVLFSEELLRLEESKKSDAVSSPKSQNVFVPQGKKLDKFELKAVSAFSPPHLKHTKSNCISKAIDGHGEASSDHLRI